MLSAMIPISFTDSLRAALPGFAVGVVEADRIVVTEHDPDLWVEIDARVAEFTRSLAGTEDIPHLPGIAATRAAYRTLGKDPTRYRGSQEALIRRVVKGKGLYRINTVVDIINLLSMECRHSCGLYDTAKLDPPIVIRAGTPGETYHGIGRDLLNIEGLPLLADRQGPFGSATSDSERTKVTTGTISILVTVLSFIGRDHLAEHCERLQDLLCRYARAERKDMSFRII